MITRSLKPLMFEIPGFLTSEECDHIIALAQDQGLFKSLTLGDELDNGDNEEEEIEQDLDSGQGCEEFFEKDDLNGDSVLSTDELRKSLHKSLDILLSDDDLHKMIQQLQMDKDEDGSISIEECQSINHLKLFRYINDIQKKHPHYRDRFSQQTWLDQSTPEDTVLQNLRERVIKLTQLPPLIIQESEELQVVHYTVRGHYHAHYDTSNGDENKDRPCCQKFSGTVGVDCRLCRFLTILYYLNDVTSGGETAFPVADNATFDEEVFAASGISNLSVHCKDANIVVKPRKGTAVMWYNHHVDDDTGLLGSADNYAYHGGCDVIKGHKWIANNWIDAVDKDS